MTPLTSRTNGSRGHALKDTCQQTKLSMVLSFRSPAGRTGAGDMDEPAGPAGARNVPGRTDPGRTVPARIVPDQKKLMSNQNQRRSTNSTSLFSCRSEHSTSSISVIQHLFISMSFEPPTPNKLANLSGLSSGKKETALTLFASFTRKGVRSKILSRSSGSTAKSLKDKMAQQQNCTSFQLSHRFRFLRDQSHEPVELSNQRRDQQCWEPVHRSSSSDTE